MPELQNTNNSLTTRREGRRMDIFDGLVQVMREIFFIAVNFFTPYLGMKTAQIRNQAKEHEKVDGQRTRQAK